MQLTPLSAIACTLVHLRSTHPSVIHCRSLPGRYRSPPPATTLKRIEEFCVVMILGPLRNLKNHSDLATAALPKPAYHCCLTCLFLSPTSPSGSESYLAPVDWQPRRRVSPGPKAYTESLSTSPHLTISLLSFTGEGDCLLVEGQSRVVIIKIY